MCETDYLHPPTVFTFVPNDQTNGKTTITFIPPEVAGNVLSVHKPFTKTIQHLFLTVTCVKNTAHFSRSSLVPTGKWTSGKRLSEESYSQQ